MSKCHEVILLGYSGHAYVICDIFKKLNYTVIGYQELKPVSSNPYDLKYMEHETREIGRKYLQKYPFFIAVGSNKIRKKIAVFLENYQLFLTINAIHPSAVISDTANIGKGIMVGTNVSINALATIGDGVICNTGCIIEHECTVGAFAHIAPGAVLAGNVSIGSGSFIGANSIIKQGVKIGKNVIVGAGAVILKDIPDNSTVVGNPQRFI